MEGRLVGKRDILNLAPRRRKDAPLFFRRARARVCACTVCL